LNDVGLAVELDDEELVLEWHQHNEKRLEILKERGLVVEVKTLNLKAPLGYIGMPIDG
jgi:hypothetical protein